MKRRNDPALRERERQAVLLRQEGLDYNDIASQLGYANRSGAYKAVRRCLDHRVEEEVEQLRQLEGERLDHLHRSLWEPACKGDMRALDRLLRVMDARCRLLGLYLPQKLNPQRREPMVVQFGSSPESAATAGLEGNRALSNRLSDDRRSVPPVIDSGE